MNKSSWQEHKRARRVPRQPGYIRWKISDGLHGIESFGKRLRDQLSTNENSQVNFSALIEWDEIYWNAGNLLSNKTIPEMMATPSAAATAAALAERRNNEMIAERHADRIFQVLTHSNLFALTS